MTKAEIIQRAAQDLEDEGLVHFLQRDFNDSFQDGYELVSLITQCIESSVSIATVANQPFYNLSALISNYYRIFAIYDLTNNRWLTPEAFTTFKTYSSRFLITTGHPREWTPLGWNYLLLHPTPQAVVNLLCFYKTVATEIADGTSPEIPTESHDILQKYIVGDLMDQNLEYTKGKLYMDKFMLKIFEVKERVKKRDWPDRIMALTDGTFF